MEVISLCCSVHRDKKNCSPFPPPHPHHHRTTKHGTPAALQVLPTAENHITSRQYICLVSTTATTSSPSPRVHRDGSTSAHLHTKGGRTKKITQAALSAEHPPHFVVFHLVGKVRPHATPLLLYYSKRCCCCYCCCWGTLSGASEKHFRRRYLRHIGQPCLAIS